MPTLNTLPKKPSAVQIIDLNGEWTLRQAGKKEVIKALVPGTVHTDLLAAGKIPDPYYQDNEDRVQWIGEADWIYKRTFNVPKDYLLNEQVLLCCEGLDTLATIKINAAEIARTDNMFRTYEFDVKNILKAGHKHHRNSVRFHNSLHQTAAGAAPDTLAGPAARRFRGQLGAEGTM